MTAGLHSRHVDALGLALVGQVCSTAPGPGGLLTVAVALGLDFVPGYARLIPGAG